MNLTRRRSLIAMMLILSAMLIEKPADAKKTKLAFSCPTIPEEETAAIELGRELFEKGEELAKKNKFGKAIIQFLCAASIKDHINITLNIAQTARYMKNKKRLLKTLKDYIEEHPNTETSKEMSKIISEMKK